jgi:hypothetical protein
MQRQSVTSNHLRSVGYDPSTKTLEVEFKNGRIYQYAKVPTEEFDALMTSESHHEYLNDNIKSTFSYREIV